MHLMNKSSNIDLLMSADNDQLQQILDFYKLPIARFQKEDRILFDTLAQSLYSSNYIKYALCMMDYPEYSLFIYFLQFHQPFSYSRLQASLNPKEADLLEKLTHSLMRKGFLFHKPMEYVPPLDFSEFDKNDTLFEIPIFINEGEYFPKYILSNLYNIFSKYPVQTLKEIAKTLNITDIPKNKENLIYCISGKLREPDFILSLVRSLSPGAKAIINRLLKTRKYMRISDLSSELNLNINTRYLIYGWMSNWYTQSTEANVITELLFRGLLACEESDWGYRDICMLPYDIRTALDQKYSLHSTLSAERLFESIPAKKLEVHYHYRFSQDVVYLLSFIGKFETRLTNSGAVYMNAVKQLCNYVSKNNPDYVQWLFYLAEHTGLMDFSGPQRMAVCLDKGKKWLNLPVLERIKELLNTLLSAEENLFSEIKWDAFGIGEGNRYDRDAHTKISILPLLFHSLREINETEAVTLSSFLERLCYKHPAIFGMPQGNIKEIIAARDFENPELNDMIQQTIKCMLGNFYWAGLVENAAESTSNEIYLRQGLHTPLLSKSEKNNSNSRIKELEAEEEKFIIQPNHEVYASPYLKAGVLYRLMILCELNKDQTPMLTANSIRAALDTGETSESIISFLEKYSRTGVPQGVRMLINDTGERHGHIHVGSGGIYIQTRDPILLQELLAQKSLKIHLRKQLTDTIALVTGDSVNDIMKQLRLAGYQPVHDTVDTPSKTRMESRQEKSRKRR
jgi:hypothetical protein